MSGLLCNFDHCALCIVTVFFSQIETYSLECKQLFRPVLHFKKCCSSRQKTQQTEAIKNGLHFFHASVCTTKNAKFTFFHFDALGLQKISQAIDLLFQLANQLGIGILVYHSLTNDLLGTIGVPLTRNHLFYVIFSQYSVCKVNIIIGEIFCQIFVLPKVA